MKSFVSINEIVANAATIIKDARKEDRNLFRQWAYLAERAIGHSKTSEKVYETTIQDLCFAKPLDYATAIDLSILDSQGTGLKYTYRGPSRRIHPSTGMDELHNKTIDVYEDAHFFNLGSRGDIAHSARLRYYAYPIDDEGELLVPEDHLQAIMWYIRWMWEWRKSENPRMMQLAEREWSFQHDKARSKNKMPDMLRGKEIAKNYSSMIDKLMPYKY